MGQVDKSSILTRACVLQGILVLLIAIPWKSQVRGELEPPHWDGRVEGTAGRALRPAL